VVTTSIAPPWDAAKTLGVVWSSVGDNYSFGATPNGRAVCRVWRRPDLPSADGARSAEEMGALMRNAASRTESVGMLFDLRDAPFIAGPRTEAALTAMLASWDQARKRCVIVLSDNPMQQLQMKRLVEKHAPRYGLATPILADAQRHLGI
jgi:hypothetical protein